MNFSFLNNVTEFGRIWQKPLYLYWVNLVIFINSYNPKIFYFENFTFFYLFSFSAIFIYIILSLLWTLESFCFLFSKQNILSRVFQKAENILQFMSVEFESLTRFHTSKCAKLNIFYNLAYEGFYFLPQHMTLYTNPTKGVCIFYNLFSSG